MIKKKVLKIVFFILYSIVIAIIASYVSYNIYENNNSKQTDNSVNIDSEENNVLKKPVIYFYPKQKEDVTIKLSLKGTLTASYPLFNNKISGWQVTAYPNGKLIDKTDGAEYSYIFWEGKPLKTNYDISTGFIVKGSDTADFLKKTLSRMGLNAQEYNDFIVFWLPQMQINKYNLIHFAGNEYTTNANLDITPKPDSLLRVFMIYKGLNAPINIKTQNIPLFVRSGFSVIEWGGSEL